jgi:hypothetical protein
MAKLLRLGWILAFAAAALTYPVAWLIGRGAVEVYFVTPYDAKTVEVNRGLFQLDQPDPKAPDYDRKVMGLYGLPNENPDVVVFPSKERLFSPPEKASLKLLFVDKDKGENPLQLKTVYFFAKWILRASLAGGVLLLAVWLLVSRRRPAPAP